MKSRKIKQLFAVGLLLGCLLPLSVHGEVEAVGEMTVGKKKIILPRPKVELTDEYVRSLPLETAQKVMFEKLEIVIKEYELNFMAQLHLDVIESPIGRSKFGRKVLDVIKKRTSSSELVPSVFTPVVYKMLDNVFLRYEVGKEELETHIQESVASQIEPLKAKIEELQKRVNKFDSLPPVTGKKGFKEFIADSFRNPAFQILLAIQLALTFFILFKLT